VGISLRAAPIIRPSVISLDRKNIAHGIVYRLSSDFQEARFVLWGILPENTESQKVLALIKEQYEMVFRKPVHIIANAESASAQDIQACGQPCWLLLSADKANVLTPNEFVSQKIQPLNEIYFSITWMPFKQVETIPDYCIQEKRLTIECLRVLAIAAFQRKMKPGPQYFFMEKYNEKDYFLFFQEAPQT
jgi:hypothetical protein